MSDRPKTYDATDLVNKRAEMFREAGNHKKILINHDRYPGLIFELTSRERRVDNESSA